MTARPAPEPVALASPEGANAAAFTAERDDVFSRIAGRYDLLCDLFSLMIHRAWKQHMARRVLAHDWRDMLDAASGTGAIALRVARAMPEGAGRRITVSDICHNMLAVAQRRAGPRPLPLTFRHLDAEALVEIPDGSIDLYTISFAMKICDRTKVMREAFRVLKPDGWFLCLEASDIPFRPLQLAYLAYMTACMPVIGSIATGGDHSAYDYLLRGIHAFPGADAFAAEMAAQGFAEVTFRRLSLGIVAIHEGRKPLTS